MKPCSSSDGNATPNGDPDWIIAQGRKMYEDLSAETTGFIHYMPRQRPDGPCGEERKAGGGYCTYHRGTMPRSSSLISMVLG